MPAMRASRLAVVATLLLLLACVAVAGSWLWARQALEQGIARWRAEPLERGYTIDYAGPRFSGFPFVLAVSIEAPRVTGAEDRRVGEECVSTCQSRWSPDH